MTATLAGRPFERVTVDVGFAGLPAPDSLRGPDLLVLADIAPLTIPALPLTRHIAEKLHAYTATTVTTGRTRGSRTSSTWR